MPTEGKKSAYRERNSTADRALDILGLFTEQRMRITGADLASELGVARSTAYRYIQTLTASGYLEEDPSGGFRLGLRVFELARIARRAYGLSEVAIPLLREVAVETGETALLTRRFDDRIVCLEKIDDEAHHVRLSYERGSVLPLNSGASAWVLLAWEDPAVVDELLARSTFASPTPNSLTDPARIRERLSEIREAGYAVSQGELDPHVVGIAAPIRDDAGRVVAGASVVSFARRLENGAEGVDALAERVRDVANQISERIALSAQ
ncbi:IclR family transcriptional regulator [Leucobacter sp. USHLN153]|uniref:IclR family transcriptional regulator n=1 Tax=Leucobacter sp. USHLN153 TaxID=3081268 RepID=UPI00301989C6